MTTPRVQLRDDYHGFVARVRQRPLVSTVIWGEVALIAWYGASTSLGWGYAPAGLQWAFWLLLPLLATGLLFTRYLYVRVTPTRVEVSGWVGPLLRPQTLTLPLEGLRVRVFRGLRVQTSPATALWIRAIDGRWHRLGRLQASSTDLAPLVARLEAASAAARPGLSPAPPPPPVQLPGSAGHVTASSPG